MAQNGLYEWSNHRVITNVTLEQAEAIADKYRAILGLPLNTKK
jgi:hypothetical protein